MKCTVIECEQHVHQPRHYVLPQRHEGFEVVYYISGAGTTTIQGETFNFEPGSVALIPAGIDHDEASQVAGSVLFCNFRIEDSTMPPIEKSVLVDKNGCNKPVYNILNQIYAETVSKGPYYQEYLNVLLQELLLAIRRLVDKHQKKSNVIKYMEEYIQKMYHQPIDFVLLSESLGYSYDRLRHVFRERNDVSLNQYLINTRIAAGKKYLKETNLSINEIAGLCGYKNTANFIAAFKEKIGTTPLQYRREVLRASERAVVFEKDE